MMTFKRLLSLLTTCLLGLGLLTAMSTASTAQAATGPVFTVMNTSESLPDGVYFRNSPSWNDTSRTYGLGVFMNEQVQLQCYAFGEAVGPYNNQLWYYTLNVSRPVNYDGQANQGMLNAHYINDGQAANVVDAGIPACVNNRPPAPTAVPSVTLTQGPAAPAGYRYAIALSGFAANAGISVACYDSVSPAGFYTFTLTTDGSGAAFTQDYCYSGDGPDHWVVANGVQSNHVTWGGGGSTPPPVASVTLAQGPAASAGYWYSITVNGFAVNANISVTCYDSVSPSGFRTFSITASGSGSASTQAGCFSGDGPDHWVIANGVESNHLSWGSSSPGGGGGTGGGSGTGPTGPVSPVSATFFSPNNDLSTGVNGITAGDTNLKLSQWSAGSCSSVRAPQKVPLNSNTLAGWSLGRLGPIYFLDAAPADRVKKVRTIILFDPGSTADFANPPLWKRVLGKSTCDWHYPINSLLANWLSSNSANRLLILTGADSEEKVDGHPTYAGLWKYYLAGIWNKPFADRAQVCDYDQMAHLTVLSTFSYIIKKPVVGCPSGPNLTSWHP